MFENFGCLNIIVDISLNRFHKQYPKTLVNITLNKLRLKKFILVDFITIDYTLS